MWIPLLCTVVLALPGLFIPRLVLGCVYEAEKRNQLPTQFMMTDIMWLILVVQLCVAPLGIFEYRGDLIPFYMLALLGLPIIWWHSLRVLSRAGVLGFWRRGLFLIIAPATLLCTIVSSVAGLAVPFLWLNTYGSSFGHYLPVATCGLAAAATIAIAVGLRFAANFVIAPASQSIQ